MRTLLVPITGSQGSNHVLDAGFMLANRFAAHLKALYIRPDPRAAIPFMGEGLTADAIQDLVDVTEREGKARAARALAVFEQRREKAGIAEGDGTTGKGASAQWEETVGFIAERAGRAARLADLAIVPQPAEGHGEDSAELLNEVLFRSGRPLLMIPPATLARLGEHVMIAWNGRAECARTVAAALPLLKHAKKLTLLRIGEEHPDRPSLDSLAVYLARHGLSGEAVRRKSGSGTVGDGIVEAAHDLGADLIVMGAYSHNRWREMIIGGVTRHAIQKADLPVLMSH